MLFSELKGHILQKIDLIDGVIWLETDKVTGKIEAFGDCCSTGWIGELQYGALPIEIIEASCGDEYNDREVVEHNDPRLPSGDNYWDHVVLYPGNIKTATGLITFNVWNNSNGYYGSSLHFTQLSEK